jgi:hypothetical protein
LVGELGGGVVGIAVFFFVVGFGLASLYGVVKVGLGEGLEGEQGDGEGGGGGVEASVVGIGGFFSAVLEALKEKYGGEEREKGEKGAVNNEVEVHGRPFSAGGAQAWIVAPMKAAAMFPIAGRSGLRGRRTLEEGGPYVVVGCNNVVSTWPVRDGAIDPLDEEEDGGEEEESGGVMIGCVREDEEQHGDEGCEESKKFPAADFCRLCHRWIECIARPDSRGWRWVRFGSGTFTSHPSQKARWMGHPGVKPLAAATR